MTFNSSIVNLSSVPWSFKSKSSPPDSLAPWSDPCVKPCVEVFHAPTEIIDKLPTSRTVSKQNHPVEPLGTRNTNVILRSLPSNTVLSSAGQLSSTCSETPLKNPQHAYNGTLPLPPWHTEDIFRLATAEVLENIDLNADIKTGTSDILEKLYTSDEGVAQAGRLAYESEETPLSEVPPRIELDTESKKSCVHIGLPSSRSSKHPKRSLSLSRSTQTQKPPSLTLRKDRWTLDDNDTDPSMGQFKSESGHRKSSSWSSTGILDVVKAATSALTKSKPLSSRRRLPQSLMERYSTASGGENTEGPSRESPGDVDSTNKRDASALGRSLQRHKIVQELLASEMSYIDDIKILSHVYLSLLASHSAVSITFQEDFQLIISDILGLHEDILPYLKALVYDPSPSSYLNPSLKQAGHRRQQSLDGVKHVLGLYRSQSQKRSSHVAPLYEPKRVAEVALLFEGLISKLFVYEEYAANYETTLKTFIATSKAIPSWAAYERGVEALMNSLHPGYASEEHNKKGMTIEDLLIKPIQRVCRYPLIFGELENQCPTIDDPVAHVQIGRVTELLRKIAQGIDSAIDDEKVRSRIQRTRHLEELLSGPRNARLPPKIRPLGHTLLCGALYVAHHSSAGDVRGQYMLCALFAAHFIFASYDANSRYFKIQGLLKLSAMQVMDTNNGKGLQCREAPFSCKLLFGLHEQIYEVTLCAATECEHHIWRSALDSSSRKVLSLGSNQFAVPESPLRDFLLLDIRPLHTVRPNGLDEQASKQSTIISAPTYTMPFTIKNTWAPLPPRTNDSPASSEPTSPPNRSKLLIAKERIPVLSPPRADRIRLEQAMTDVWTKDALPYPVMTTDRSGPSFMQTANSMMRKLSKASITSSPSRRSHSMNSISAISLPQLDGVGRDDPFVDDLDIVAARHRLRFAIPDPFVTETITEASDLNMNAVETGEGCEPSVSATTVKEDIATRAVARRISFCEDVVGGKGHGGKGVSKISKASGIDRISENGNENGQGTDAEADIGTDVPVDRKANLGGKGEIRSTGRGKNGKTRTRVGALGEGIRSWFS